MTNIFIDQINEIEINEQKETWSTIEPSQVQNAERVLDIFESTLTLEEL